MNGSPVRGMLRFDLSAFAASHAIRESVPVDLRRPNLTLAATVLSEQPGALFTALSTKVCAALRPVANSVFRAARRSSRRMRRKASTAVATSSGLTRRADTARDVVRFELIVKRVREQ